MRELNGLLLCHTEEPGVGGSLRSVACSETNMEVGISAIPAIVSDPPLVCDAAPEITPSVEFVFLF